MDFVAPACQILDILDTIDTVIERKTVTICEALRHGRLAEAEAMIQQVTHLWMDNDFEASLGQAIATLIEGAVAHGTGNLSAAQDFYIDAYNSLSALDSSSAKYNEAVACLCLCLATRGTRNRFDAAGWGYKGLRILNALGDSHAKAARLKAALDRQIEDVWDSNELNRHHKRGKNQLPIVGTTAAGNPRFALTIGSEQARWNDLILNGRPHRIKREIEPNWLTSFENGRRGQFLAAQVEGNSMIEAGIGPGDFVIFREQPHVESGEIAIVTIEYLDGTYSTTKRFYQEDGRIVLKAANSDFQPQELVFQESDPTITVLGKVVAVASPVATKLR